MAMTYEPVASSSIAAMAYDPASQTLGVQFHNGGEYHYSGVTPQAFESFKGAKSLGAHFMQAVRPHYKATKQEKRRP